MTDIDDEYVEYDGKLYKRTIVRGYPTLRLIVDGKVDDSKTILEHRVIYELSHGVKLPKDIQIHHLNRNRCDNRPENLIALNRVDHVRLHAYEESVTELAEVKPVTVLSKRKAVQEFAKRVVVYDGKPYYRIKGRGGFTLYPIDENGVHSKKRVSENRLVYELAHRVCLLPGVAVKHANNDKYDNRPENLYLVYGKGPKKKENEDEAEALISIERVCVDCGKPIDSTSVRCKKCEIIHRGRHITDKITRDELEDLIQDHTNRAIAKMYNVSESAVKYWRYGFGLPSASEMARIKRDASKNASDVSDSGATI